MFAESRDELQVTLNGKLHYCNIWKLEINSQKTKVVIYGSNDKSNVADFKFGNQFISVVCEYTYLGSNMAQGSHRVWETGKTGEKLMVRKKSGNFILGQKSGKNQGIS